MVDGGPGGTAQRADRGCHARVALLLLGVLLSAAVWGAWTPPLAPSEVLGPVSASVNGAATNESWVVLAGGTNAGHVADAEPHPDGALVLAGWFRRTATFGSTQLASAGDEDAWAGHPLDNGTWAWSGGRGSHDRSTAVAVTADGRARVTGLTPRTSVTTR